MFKVIDQIKDCARNTMRLIQVACGTDPTCQDVNQFSPALLALSERVEIPSYNHTTTQHSTPHHNPTHHNSTTAHTNSTCQLVHQVNISVPKIQNLENQEKLTQMMSLINDSVVKVVPLTKMFQADRTNEALLAGLRNFAQKVAGLFQQSSTLLHGSRTITPLSPSDEVLHYTTQHNTTQHRSLAKFSCRPTCIQVR